MKDLVFFRQSQHKRKIERALKRNHGVVRFAAKALKISDSTLYDWIAKHGIDLEAIRRPQPAACDVQAAAPSREVGPAAPEVHQRELLEEQIRRKVASAYGGADNRGDVGGSGDAIRGPEDLQSRYDRLKR